MLKRYQGRHRRPTSGLAVRLGRPTVVAAAAAAVTFAGSSAASAADYVVRPGDTLNEVAADHGASWRTVYAANRGAIGGNPNLLRVGTVLEVGGSAPSRPAASRSSASRSSGSYVVRSGDTLGSIAARHGTTWRSLHALNRGTIGANPHVLRVGQRLAVSGSAAPAARAAAAAPSREAPRASRSGERTAPRGSYQDYALRKLGGNRSQFSCLVSLWGKESGWNPAAQNPTSSAYGIAQFLDSTWAGTGIAKTSDGHRQIDAGLVYINNRYGSPCGAWSHFQAKRWY